MFIVHVHKVMSCECAGHGRVKRHEEVKDLDVAAGATSDPWTCPYHFDHCDPAGHLDLSDHGDQGVPGKPSCQCKSCLCTNAT